MVILVVIRFDTDENGNGDFHLMGRRYNYLHIHIGMARTAYAIQ